MAETTLTVTETDIDDAAELVTEDLVEDELLIEEISIDGMCGVY